MALPPAAPPPPAEAAVAVTVAPRGGPVRALWQLLQPVLAMLLLLAVVGGALGGVAVWLLRSAEGTAWLLARLPGLEVRGTRGALLSERFAVEHLVVRWDGGRQSVTIEGFDGQGLDWAWHPAPGALLGLRAAQLQARLVAVHTGPPGPRPITMPRSLQMPLRLHAAQVHLAELRIDGITPLRNLQGQGVHLWEPGGREYRADAVTLDWDRARIDGDIAFGALPPFTLQSSARLVERTADGTPPAWTAQARVQGPLARFEFTVGLQGTAVAAPRPRQAAAGTPAVAPALDVEATITPLDAWPLARLRLRTQALDLAALASGAPRTALSGSADIDTRAKGGPLAAAIELDNALPGRWDEGRLPVRRLQARLRSPDADRQRLLLEDAEAWLANGRDNAGRWRASGQWLGGRLQLESRLDDLRPQALDQRAAAMTLTGPVDAVLNGLPSPDLAGTQGTPAVAALTLDLKAALEGRLDASPQAVQLTLDASASPRLIDVRQLRAQAGGALAQLSLEARRGGGTAAQDRGTGSADWQLRSTGQLSDFDPLPWWPGAEGSAWRTGTHRLSGSWALDVKLPPPGRAATALALAQSVVGTGTVKVERSLLAGVPLAAQFTLGHRAGATPSTVQGELSLGGNRLVVDGEGDPLGSGQTDRLQLDLQADALAGLAPLARLLPDLAAWAPAGGTATASVRVEGRWPDVRSEGQAQLQGLQLGTLTARQAQARWRFDTTSDQPLLVQAEAQALALGAQRLEQLRADVRGTWRAHQVDLAAALPSQPGKALELAFGLRTAAGTLARLRADGEWSPDGSGGGRWAGQLTQLALGAWSGSGLSPAGGPTGGGAGRAASAVAGSATAVGGATTWLDTRDLRAELRFDARDGFTEARATAGQARLADAITLRWDDVRIDLRGAAPAWALRADIEPFELAPLLARVQPTLGWTGDLRLAARMDLKVGDKVDADLVFERRDGDLRMAEENASQPFGLNELRLVASAHDGQWQMAGAFAGKTLGEASWRVNLQHRPEQRWPTAATPVDGVLEAHVGNLGVWGTWVPPGWRLSGEMRTSARVAGTLGNPDFSGEIRATDVALRNLLLGVDVRNGEALLRLSGPSAFIERFDLRGGEGRLKVGGQVDLGGPVVARLRIDAERFRALGRVDRQLTTSGRLDLVVSAEQLQATGQVRVDEGLYDVGRSDAPTLDDDVTVRQGPGRADEPAGPVATRSRRATQIAIDLDLGDKLKVRGRGLDAVLGGNLRLGSAAGRPTVNGVVSASNGTYVAWGQKLDIDRGLLIFTGDVESPTLDVRALRPDLDVQVGVEITGNLHAPRVRLYSGGDMSDSDKLSWLVLGRASDGLGRSDTALLQRAAVALLAGEGEAPTDTLLRRLGLDSLSVRQSDTDVRETVISLGKQLSQRWYVGYERGVNATTGTWQLIYRVAQRFTLRAQSGSDNAIDLIWTWRW